MKKVDDIILIENNFMKLEFWKDAITYEGVTVPTGTVGCDVLNISDELLEDIKERCDVLNAYLTTILSGKIDFALMKPCGDAVVEILQLLQNIKPFSYIDLDHYLPGIQAAYEEKAKKQLREVYKIARKTGLNDEQYKEFKESLLMLCLTPTFANLAFSLKEYKHTITSFAELLDDATANRSIDGMAEIFQERFPDAMSTEDGMWMANQNVTVQYVARKHPEKQIWGIARQMYYMTFVSMLRSDLFEGLRVGHAPKKCAICGKWFLTTNARRTKYCGGLAPNDPLGRTCRQIGNLQGREQRELAADHPIKQIYERRMNTIHHCVKRNTIDIDTAAVMKKLAKDKMQRALSDPHYAQESYEAEMEQQALLEAATR